MSALEHDGYTVGLVSHQAQEADDDDIQVAHRVAGAEKRLARSQRDVTAWHREQALDNDRGHDRDHVSVAWSVPML
jgi:hypothetical protein